MPTTCRAHWWRNASQPGVLHMKQGNNLTVPHPPRLLKSVDMPRGELSPSAFDASVQSMYNSESLQRRMRLPRFEALRGYLGHD